MGSKTDLFARLGGIRNIAEFMGEAPSTVQSWKTAGRIPAKRQPDLIMKATKAGYRITADDVVWPFGKPRSRTSASIAVCSCGHRAGSAESRDCQTPVCPMRAKVAA